MAREHLLKIGVSGVRGVVGQFLTPGLALAFAQAFGTYVGRGRVVVGRDTRTSGPMLQHAVSCGLLAAGCEVIDVGVMPTPTVQIYKFLQLIYTSTVSEPSRLLIGTPTFKVTISPECSGYEGVGLILAFLGIYLWLFRKDLRFPAALILLPLGAATIWIVNAPWSSAWASLP